MQFAGDAMVNGLAVFDGEGWQRLGTFDGVVWDMLEWNGDLWVVGDFRTAGGVPANGVARYDGTRWYSLAGGPNLLGCYGIAVYQGQIHVGTVGSPVRWTGSSWQPFGTQVFGTLTDLHVHNGILYLGGSTPFMAGSPNLLQWDGTTLSVVGGGTNEAVVALGSFGADLVVGGRFTAAGGQPMEHITLWNGQSFRPIGGGLAGSTVVDFEMFQGQLVACGDIRLAGGLGNYVVRFDGASWRAGCRAAAPTASCRACSRAVPTGLRCVRGRRHAAPHGVERGGTDPAGARARHATRGHAVVRGHAGAER